MQATLFHSIKPLFANKPVLIVANKTDVTRLEELDPANRALVEEMAAEALKISSGGEAVSGANSRPVFALVRWYWALLLGSSTWG